MSTLTNYEGLLALSTSPHLSQAMREYLVGVLAEHREMRAALHAVLGRGYCEGRSPSAQDYVSKDAVAVIRAILAKVEA